MTLTSTPRWAAVDRRVEGLNPWHIWATIWREKRGPPQPSNRLGVFGCCLHEAVGGAGGHRPSCWLGWTDHAPHSKGVAFNALRGGSLQQEWRLRDELGRQHPHNCATATPGGLVTAASTQLDVTVTLCEPRGTCTGNISSYTIMYLWRGMGRRPL